MKDRFSTMGIGLLRELATEWGLDATGTRKALIDRLRQEDMDRVAGKPVEEAEVTVTQMAGLPMAKVPAEGAGVEPEDVGLEVVTTAGSAITAKPARAPDQVKKGSRWMVVPMTAEQLADLSREMSAKIGERDSIEGRRSAISKELGEQIKRLMAEISEMAQTHRQGGHYDQAELEVSLWMAEGIALEVVKATGEVVEVRELLESERQAELPGISEPAEETAEAATPAGFEPEITLWLDACHETGDPKCRGDVEIFTHEPQPGQHGDGGDWVALVGELARCCTCGLMFGVVEHQDGDVAITDLAPIADGDNTGAWLHCTRAEALQAAEELYEYITYGREETFPGDDGGVLAPPSRPGRPGAEVTA